MTLRPNEYDLGGRIANYPEYVANEYKLNSSKDSEIISKLKSDIDKLVGLGRFSELRQTKNEKEKYDEIRT